MKKKAFSKMLALLLAVMTLVTNVAVMSVSAEATCPGKSEKHTLANCPDATTVNTVVGEECGVWGYTVYQCPVCEAYFADSFKAPAKEHIWESTADQVDATCGTAGTTKVFTCKNCGATKGGTTIPATGEHNWGKGVVTSTAAEGCKITYTCQDCGEEKVVEGEHDWSDAPTLVKAPTYTEDGLATYTCKLCGATKDVVVACEHECELEHHDEKAPTCIEAGNVAYDYCTICHRYFVNGEVVAEDKVVVAATGHNFKDSKNIIETLAPTCTTTGTGTAKCLYCDATETVVLPMKEHNYAVNNKVEATCTQWGYNVVTCLDCGAASIENIAPLGHDYVSKDEGADDSEPTCVTAGHTYEICTRLGCNNVKDNVIPATGCHYVSVTVPATCKTYEYTFYYCDNEGCDNYAANTLTSAYIVEINGEKVTFDVTVGGKSVMLWNDVATTEAGHEMNFSVNVKKGYDATNHSTDLDNIKLINVNAPTCVKEGNAAYYCENCNVYFTEVIPATGHNYADVEDDAGSGLVTKKSDVTCTTDEVYTVQCKDCAATKDVVTKVKTGHKLVENVIAPTCQIGYTEVTCSNPGCKYYLQKDQTPALEYKLEYTLDEAKASHDLDLDSKATYRVGNCVTVGLDTYKCNACGKYVLVVTDNTGKGHTPTHELAKYPGSTENITNSTFETEFNAYIYSDGGTLYEFAAKAATCTEYGWTAQYQCSCGEVVKATLINPLGHTFKDSDQNCTSEVKCERCDATLAIKPHTYGEPADSREADCLLFGYDHVICSVCGKEEIINYKKELGHTVVKDDAVAPSCTETGLTAGSRCSECEAVLVAQEVVAATGHHNKAGDLLENKCTSEVKDRVCKDCGKTIGSEHNYVLQAEVSSDCVNYGYKLEVCEYCKDEKVTDFDYLSDHQYEEVEEECVAPTYHEMGSKVEKCSVCGDKKVTEIPVLEGIGYFIDVENNANADAAIVDSSLIKVTVSIDANDVEAWGYKFSMIYDSTVLEFVDADFVSDKFITMPTAHDNNDIFADERSDSDEIPYIGAVTVAAFTANGEDKKPANSTISEEQAIVELYFRVVVGQDADYDVESGVEIIGDADVDEYFPDELKNLLSETIKAMDKIDGESIPTSGNIAEFTVEKFADVNGDGDFNLPDVLAVYNIVTGASEITYDAAADVDKDGEITIDDFTNLYNYLIGAISYEELAAIGTVVAE